MKKTASSLKDAMLTLLATTRKKTVLNGSGKMVQTSLWAHKEQEKEHELLVVTYRSLMVLNLHDSTFKICMESSLYTCVLNKTACMMVYF